jgi:hypothetical protein
MPQLMAGHPDQSSPSAGAVEDLVHPGRRQRRSASSALEHNENPPGGRRRRLLLFQIGAQGSEEPSRHRDNALPTALALGEEQTPFT